MTSPGVSPSMFNAFINQGKDLYADASLVPGGTLAGAVNPGLMDETTFSGIPEDFPEEWANKASEWYSGTFGDPNITSVEDLVRKMGPEAAALIEESTREAADLTGLGLEESLKQFQPFGAGGQEAFTQQQALLGLMGPDAQALAISEIRDTPFQQEVDLRQRRKLLREAAAGGELGSGAAIQGMAQLAGAQAGERILRKVDELQPLVDMYQTTTGAESTLTEDARARQMQLIASLGPQISAILLGQAAPIVQSQLQGATLKGMERIGGADEMGQILGQIAGLAGGTNFFGLGNLGGTTAPTVPAVPPGSILT